ncbi:hypothetical protein BD560DRAFT_446147 [Blakeslea trispora]|nr:hypothetical protein BD560DRAFT_446147 [Blakeslea trispora]
MEFDDSNFLAYQKGLSGNHENTVSIKRESITPDLDPLRAIKLEQENDTQSTTNTLNFTEDLKSFTDDLKNLTNSLTYQRLGNQEPPREKPNQESLALEPLPNIKLEQETEVCLNINEVQGSSYDRRHDFKSCTKLPLIKNEKEQRRKQRVKARRKQRTQKAAEKAAEAQRTQKAAEARRTQKGSLMPKMRYRDNDHCMQCGVLFHDVDDESYLSCISKYKSDVMCLGCVRFTRYLKGTANPYDVMHWLMNGQTNSYQYPTLRFNPESALLALQANESKFLENCKAVDLTANKKELNQFLKIVSQKEDHYCAITGQQIFISRQTKQSHIPPWALTVDFLHPLRMDEDELQDRSMETLCYALFHVKHGTCTNEEVMRWLERFKALLKAK